MYTKSKILIAGGAGFIGSHLCRKLVSDNNNYVVCMDNLKTGSLNNLVDLQNLENFLFIEHDVKDEVKIECDWIFNAACPASPKAYQEDAVDTILTNLMGTKNLLDLANLNSAKFMQFSTSEVYGNPLEHPQKETYFGNVNTIGLRSCYDEGKRVAETLCFDYMRQFGTQIRVIRIFNTYGPNMDIDDGRVVSNFIVAALKNKNIKIYGDGNQTRSFQYISDLIEAIIIYMNKEDDFPGPINLGNPNELNMLDLAKLVIEKTHSSSQIEFCDLPKDDPIKRKPDITLAKDYLGWSPKVPLSVGLDNTIDYFKKVLAIQ